MDINTTETAASTSKRRKFTSEFREASVRLVTQEGYSFTAAAKAVGVGEQSLRQWHAKLSQKPAFCGDDATVEELRAENRRLWRHLRQVELEREILKRATVGFAKKPA